MADMKNLNDKKNVDLKQNFYFKEVAARHTY